jgi:Domain of unknown function (DUF5753)/Helix-turn-helix domain
VAYAGAEEFDVTEKGAQGGPVAMRISLGGQLRKLREAAGFTRGQAGYEIRSSESKISRMELGKVAFKERDIVDLLSLYGLAEGEERDRLIALARNANSPGWWNAYGDLLPNWFQTYLDLEAAAEIIRMYEIQLVPGLLQTPDYVRALMQLGRGIMTADEIERRVALRVSRQEALTRHDPIRLWAVIDEAALRRQLGGVEVMRVQLEHLIEVNKLKSVTLQVMPFTAGGHAITTSAFSLLRFTAPELPNMVYIEHLTNALYLDKSEDVDRYSATMDALSVAAPEPRRTHDELVRILKELDD